MITVKIGKLPGTLRELALADCSTVGQALSTAGINPSGHQITVDGSPADERTVLSEGAKVILTKNIKGNA